MTASLLLHDKGRCSQG